MEQKGFMAQRLRFLRDDLGWTREKVSDDLGLGTNSLYQWESGSNDPSIGVVKRLAAYYGVSADYLLGLSDNPAPFDLGQITPKEIAVLRAWRAGDLLTAIRIIVNT